MKWLASRVVPAERPVVSMRYPWPDFNQRRFGTRDRGALCPERSRGRISDPGSESTKTVLIRAYSVQPQVRRTTGRSGHPQHGLGDRRSGPEGAAGSHGGVDLPDRQDPPTPARRQRFHRLGYLVSARRKGQLAFSQADRLAGNRQRLAFGGTTTTHSLLTRVLPGQRHNSESVQGLHDTIGHATQRCLADCGGRKGLHTTTLRGRVSSGRGTAQTCSVGAF